MWATTTHWHRWVGGRTQHARTQTRTRTHLRSVDLPPKVGELSLRIRHLQARLLELIFHLRFRAEPCARVSDVVRSCVHFTHARTCGLAVACARTSARAVSRSSSMTDLYPFAVPRSASSTMSSRECELRSLPRLMRVSLSLPRDTSIRDASIASRFPPRSCKVCRDSRRPRECCCCRETNRLSSS